MFDWFNFPSLCWRSYVISQFLLELVTNNEATKSPKSNIEPNTLILKKEPMWDKLTLFQRFQKSSPFGEVFGCF